MSVIEVVIEYDEPYAAGAVLVDRPDLEDLDVIGVYLTTAEVSAT